MDALNKELDERYAEGKIAVIRTNWKAFPIYRRDMIRAAKGGGVEFRSGRKWVFAFAYQVRFATVQN